MIRFGAWSTLLAVLALQSLLLAAMLWNAGPNRLANRYLALALITIVGMLTPFILGYAGAYDAWPWLTAAPFAVSLALGPFLYGHVCALVEGRALDWRHFIAPGLQFLYQALLFPLPLAAKWWWDDAVQQPYLSPILSFTVLVSMSAYAALCWRALRRYEAWLTARRRDSRPARRIRVAAILLAALLIARAAYDLFDLLIGSVDYFDLFAFYVLLALVGLLLGFDGWRNARAPAPPIEKATERDWYAQGTAWLELLRQEGWWIDPELDLAGLAQRLGTNTAHLSRALNAGHGGLAAILAAIRAEAVAAKIDGGAEDDLLSLAMAAGFGSKASFNRAFRSRFAVTPSEYRAQRRVASDKSSAMRDTVRRHSI